MKTMHLNIVTAVGLLVSFSITSGYAQTCVTPPGVDPNRIVPVVRSAANVEASFPKSPRTAPTRRLNEELILVFAEDTKGAISYFLVEESATSCWKSADVLARSVENLPNALGRLRVVEVEPDLYMIAVGGNYEASLILLGQSLRRLTPKAAGDLVVGIPNRDVLLITGKQNERAVASLRDRVARYQSTGDHPLSTKLFVLSGNAIHVFDE